MTTVPPPSAEASAAPLAEPACLSDEMQKGARLVHAQPIDASTLAICVQKGIGGDAPTRCLKLDIPSGRFEGLPPVDLFSQSVKLGVPDLPTSSAGATFASAAGTLTVCSAPSQCMKVQVRPRARDAFDEVYGGEPAWAPGGSSKVIVATTKEGPAPKDGPPPGTLWFETYDTKEKRKIGSVGIQKNTYALRFHPFGATAFLITCSRVEERCGLLVVGADGASAMVLPVELHPDLPRGGAHAAVDLFPLARGGFGVLDVRGTLLLILDEKGKIARAVRLPSGSDPAISAARGGLLATGEIVVVESGPSAGVVNIVDPATGALRTFTPPACP